MSLFRLVCSNGFQLHSVKSKHHTAYPCPCTALSFPAHYIWPQACLSFSSKTNCSCLGVFTMLSLGMDCSALEFCRNGSFFSHPLLWGHNLESPSPNPVVLSHLSIPFCYSSLITTGNWPVHWSVYILILSPYFSMCHHACLCWPEDRIMPDVTRGTEKQ